MQKKTLDQQIFDDCHVPRSVVFNSEKEFVKHIIWKDFEKTKSFVTELLDKKDFFSPAEIISGVHYCLDDIVNYLRNFK